MSADRVADLVADICNYYGASSGRLFAVSLRRGMVEDVPAASVGNSARGYSAFDARDVGAAGIKGDVRCQALLYSEPRRESFIGADGSSLTCIALPVVARRKAFGVVILELPAHASGGHRPMSGVNHALSFMADELGRLRAEDVLAGSAEFDVELSGDNDKALASLMKFVGRVSGMQYAILRRYTTTGTLRPEAAYGFKDASVNSLGFANLSDDYGPFQYVLDSKQPWDAIDLKGPEYRVIRANPHLSDVKSFVACPVLVGQRLWGILSFAGGVEYPYSDLEILSLSVLANLAGVTLSAVQANNATAAANYDDGQLMQSVLANEVITATRHQMDSQLAIIGAGVASIGETLRPLEEAAPRRSRLSRAEMDEMTEAVAHVSIAYGEVSKILDTVRVSQLQFERQDRRVSVASAWELARAPFRYRLVRAGVHRVHCDEVGDVTGGLDLLRVAFMHLILNSLDAFDRGVRSQRTREIVLRKVGETSTSLELQYHDTAGGVDVARLVQRGTELGAGNRGVAALMFEPYVSSKASGTGLGLASVRTVLDLMGGSIELTDWRGGGGVTFALTFRKWHE